MPPVDRESYTLSTLNNGISFSAPEMVDRYSNSRRPDRVRREAVLRYQASEWPNAPGWVESRLVDQGLWFNAGVNPKRERGSLA